MNHKNCKYLNECSFNEDLKLTFSNTDIQTYEEFNEFLDHHQNSIRIRSICTFPFQKRILRANNALCINRKTLTEKVFKSVQETKELCMQIVLKRKKKAL